jgi:hypothetical protein
LIDHTQKYIGVDAKPQKWIRVERSIVIRSGAASEVVIAMVTTVEIQHVASKIRHQGWKWLSG